MGACANVTRLAADHGTAAGLADDSSAEVLQTSVPVLTTSPCTPAAGVSSLSLQAGVGALLAGSADLAWSADLPCASTPGPARLPTSAPREYTLQIQNVQH